MWLAKAPEEPRPVKTQLKNGPIFFSYSEDPSDFYEETSTSNFPSDTVFATLEILLSQRVAIMYEQG